VKRAIFRRENIQINQDLFIVSTPIRPEALRFEDGEELVVALPRNASTRVGEYQFLYRIQCYLGEDPERADAVFQRPTWRYFYGLESLAAIRPFSLEDVMAASKGREELIWERYRGQTQHHRIIRTIEAEDEPLFRGLIDVSSDPVPSVAGQIEANEAAAEWRAARDRTPDEIIRRLLLLDRRNRKTGGGKERRAASRQKRSREFVALLRVLYDDRCQVCGERLSSPDDLRSTSQVHHLTPWEGDRSDRLDNVICLCPNDHALFSLGRLRWTDSGLETWQSGEWVIAKLAVDSHLACALSLQSHDRYIADQDCSSSSSARHAGRSAITGGE
jgi:hypothetical protein